MCYKYGMLINTDGYGDLILYEIKNDIISPIGYMLKEDEEIITKDIISAINMTRPKWDGEKWIETHMEIITPEMVENAKKSALTQIKQWKIKMLEVPMEFQGNKYSVSDESRNLLSSQISLYVINSQFGVSSSLTWNTIDGPCEPWSFEDLIILSNVIAEHVSPIEKKQRAGEAMINACQTLDTIKTILVDFERER